MAFLSAAQRQFFQRHGYLSLPAFWDEKEIAAMQAELDRLRLEGKLANVATAGDGITPNSEAANLQLCPMSPHSRLFRAMGFAPRVLKVVGEILGDSFLLHLDQVFLKPAGHGLGTNWHQDNAYFKISDPLKGVALWTAVHEATVHNGTMRIIPGSFREAYEHDRDPMSNHHIRCYPPEELAVPIELPAGGVLMFAYGVAHATGANGSAADRAGVALHFLHTDYARPELLEAGRECRPILAGPGADGGVGVYGEKVAGTWPAEVVRALEKS